MAGSVYNITAWIGAEISDFQSKINRAISVQQKFHESLKIIGSSIAAAFSVQAIGNFVASSVKDFAELEEAQARLALSFKGTAKELQGLYDLAGKLQTTTTFDDTEIIKVANAFKNFGLSADQIEKAVRATTNLSAVTGDDLPTSADKLIKSLSGITRELGRQFPEIAEMSKSYLQAGGAIDFFNTKYADAAETMAQTTAGKIRAAKNEWNDFKKSVGEVALDVFSGLKKAAEFTQKFTGINAVYSVAAAVAVSKQKELAESTEKVNKSIAETPVKIKPAGESLKILREQLQAAKEKYEEATSAFERKIAYKEIERLTQKIKDLEEAAKGVVKAAKIISLPELKLSAKGITGIEQISADALAVEGFTDKLKKHLKEIQPTILDIRSELAGLVEDFAIAFGELFAKGNFQNFGSEILQALARFMGQLGSLMIATGVAALTFKLNLKTLNGPGMIAAGAALVAAAGAVSAFAQKSASGGISGSEGGGSSNITGPAYMPVYSQGFSKLNLNLKGKISGEDISLSLDRSSRYNY